MCGDSSWNRKWDSGPRPWAVGVADALALIDIRWKVTLRCEMFRGADVRQDILKGIITERYYDVDDSHSGFRAQIGNTLNTLP